MSIEGLRRAVTLLRQPTLQRTKTELLEKKIDDAEQEYKDKKKAEQEAIAFMQAESRKKSQAPVTIKDFYKTKKPEVIKEKDIEDSDEYDTDLEEEVQKHTINDRYGKMTYTKTCKRLGIRPVNAISQSLKSSAISVKGRGLTTHETLAIAYTLLQNLTVTTLHLDDNLMGDHGAGYIAFLLCDNIFISDVSLSGNKIGSIGINAIGEMLLENDIITKLNLSGNNIRDCDASIFEMVLQVNTTLQYLNLSHNHLGDEAAKILGPAISINETIRDLDLSWNKIRSVGGKEICEGISDNVILSRLSLAYNGLSIPGAVAMAEALEMNEVLTDLDLTCNRIFDDGAQKIGKALMTNESLKYLRIANNPMTTMSALGLLNVLKKNEFSQLELLDMSSVHIYKDALDLVNEIREERPEFKFMFGGVVNSSDNIGGVDDGFANKNPLSILKDFMAKKNLRLVDLFKQLDKDGGGSISREEFVTGLKLMEVPLTQHQLTTLINTLDKDGDGEVDYAELVSGEKEHRRRELRARIEAKRNMVRQRKQRKKAREAAEKAVMAAKTAVMAAKLANLKTRKEKEKEAAELKAMEAQET